MSPLTREAARERLDNLNAAIGIAVELIKGQQETLEMFLAEAQKMDSVGSILDPTLFKSEERRASEAILLPIYRSARDLVTTYDIQTSAARAALEKVQDVDGNPEPGASTHGEAA